VLHVLRKKMQSLLLSCLSFAFLRDDAALTLGFDLSQGLMLGNLYLRVSGLRALLG